MARTLQELQALDEATTRIGKWMDYICGITNDIDSLPKPKTRVEEQLEFIAVEISKKRGNTSTGGTTSSVGTPITSSNILYDDINQTGNTDVQKMLDHLENDKVDKRQKKSFIICVAGQSNAVGYDESEHTQYSTTNLNQNRLRQLGIYGDNNLKNIPLGVHAHSFQDMRGITNSSGASVHKDGTKGIHLPLGNLLLNEIPEDYEVLFVSATYGGTGFTVGGDNGYNPTTMLPNTLSGQRWGVNGPYYKAMKDRIKYALDLNPDNIFGGVIWIQGENDKNNPSSHFTEFQKMTQDFFTYFNDNNYGNRVSKGVWDKDLWYNVETVSYWYTISGCVTIWNNYKNWNSKTYVKVPKNAPCNTTTVTSSTPQAHYGHDAYIKYVAPRVLEKMKENGTLFKKHYNAIDFDSSIDATKYDATENDFEVVGNNSSFTFDSTNKTLTLNTDPTGILSSISLKNAYHIEFEATRTMYWIHFRGELGVKTVSFCIGGEMTGGISEITFPSGISNKLHHLPNVDTYRLKLGDRVSIFNEKDCIYVYLKKNTETKYKLWFRLQTDGYQYTAKDNKILGLMPGISSSEIINNQKRLILKDAKIQKGKGYINAPTLETHIYNKVIDMASNTPLSNFITDVKVGSTQNTLVFTRADGKTKTLTLTTPNNNPDWA